MTDQTIPAGQVRAIVDAMRASMRHAEDDRANSKFMGSMSVYVGALEALLPAPPFPTLADMTDEERDECQWMQADIVGGDEPLVIARVGRGGGSALILDRNGRSDWAPDEDVTPRPDLPRMAWPGDEKPDAAPALPDGWRLADHEDHGRVIVTNLTPNAVGHVYFVLPATDPLGYDWFFCDPDELRYLDTGQEADQ